MPKLDTSASLQPGKQMYIVTFNDATQAAIVESSFYQAEAAIEASPAFAGKIISLVMACPNVIA